MKRKLLTAIAVILMVSATAVEAKQDNQKPPRWMNERWSQGFRCEKIESHLHAIGLPVKAFSYLAWRESRCRVGVVGWNYHKGLSHRNCMTLRNQNYKNCFAVKSFDSGLLQINSTWVTVTSTVCNSVWGDLTVLLDRKCNLRVAKHLFDNGGFDHWK
jgi:hypothetical protein